jgi:ketosteroid isomerase-like protein
MYRMIVARRVRRAWKRLEARDWRFVLDQFGPEFSYRFAGDHAMGGTRHTQESMAAWFQRVFRLFPDIHFTVEDVLVAGWPWRTRAVALVSVEATVDGTPYRNEVTQAIEIRWGRIVRLSNLEDTQKLARALSELREGGLEEAAAAPIVDAVRAAA